MSVQILPKIDQNANKATREKLLDLRAQVSVISKLMSIMREKANRIITFVNRESQKAINHLKDRRKQLLSDIKSAIIKPTPTEDDPLLKDYVIQCNFDNLDQVFTSISKIFSIDYSEIICEVTNHTLHTPKYSILSQEPIRPGASIFKKFKDINERLRLLKLVYGINVWHPGEVTCLSLYNDDNRLVSAGKDGKLIIWDAIGGSIFKVIAAHNSIIRVLCISDTGLIFSGSSDKTVKVFSVTDYQEVNRLSLESGASCLCFDNSQSKVLVGTQKGELYVFNTKNYNGQKLIPDKSWVSIIMDDVESLILGIRVTSDENLALTYSTNGNIYIWDLINLKYKSALNTKSYITSLILTPDSQFCICSTNKAKIIIWNLSNFKEEATLKSSEETITCIIIMPNKKNLISGGKVISIWSLDTKKLLFRLEKHKERISTLKVLDDEFFIAADDSGAILLWNLRTTEAVEMSGHCRAVVGIEITRDRKTLISFSEDGTIKVNSLETKIVKDLIGHMGTIKHVKLSRNNDLIYSAGGTDGCVRVWDPATGRQTIRANQHLSGKGDEAIDKLKVSDSGNFIFSRSSLTQQILIYNMIDMCKEKEVLPEDDFKEAEKIYPELRYFSNSISNE